MSQRKKAKLINIIKRTHLNKDTFPFVANLFKHFWGNYKRDASKRIPYPYTIMLELTNKCNLHCVTCPREYGYGKEMNIGNMKSELAKNIIDQSYKYLQSIGLTGMGETLFATNLLEIAQYIKSKKKSIVIFISTNANILDFIERITPIMPYIDTIQISTDGVGDGYEKIRRNASFDLLSENLSKLKPLAKEYNVDIMFNMVITKLNYKQMTNVLKYGHENGINFVNFTYFNLASVTAIGPEYYSFFSSDEFLAELEKIKNMAKEFDNIEVSGLDFPGNPSIKKCSLMWNHFQINHDGEIPPCCAKPFSKEYSFGNVSTQKVIEVLNSKKAQDFRSCFVSGVPHDFCKKCHFLNL